MIVCQVWIVNFLVLGVFVRVELLYYVSPLFGGVHSYLAIDINETLDIERGRVMQETNIERLPKRTLFT